MMRMAMLAGAALLGGCAAAPCEPPHVYQQASTAAPLEAPSGLRIPPPDPTMSIPDVAAGAPEFVTGDPGSEERRCLAVPPPLPEEDVPTLPVALRG